jgi:hypothetical protein
MLIFKIKNGSKKLFYKNKVNFLLGKQDDKLINNNLKLSMKNLLNYKKHIDGLKTIDEQSIKYLKNKYGIENFLIKDEILKEVNKFINIINKSDIFL